MRLDKHITILLLVICPQLLLRSCHAEERSISRLRHGCCPHQPRQFGK